MMSSPTLLMDKEEIMKQIEEQSEAVNHYSKIEIEDFQQI